jgi:hypothetical protein
VVPSSLRVRMGATPLRRGSAYAAAFPATRSRVPDSPRPPTRPPTSGDDHPTSTTASDAEEGLRRSDRTVRITAIVALTGVVAALLALGYTALPLRSPTQDCGTALTFLLDGRVDEFVDPNAPDDEFTTEEAVANNTRPCQERAAGRARRAGVPFVGGIVAAVSSLVVEQVVRYRFRARTRRAWIARHRTVPPTPPVPPPPPPAPPGKRATGIDEGPGPPPT